MSAPANPLFERSPSRLWSLWDMLEVSAYDYVQLGTKITYAWTAFKLAETNSANSPRRELFDNEKEILREALEDILEICNNLNLPVSKILIGNTISNPPRTSRELDILVQAVLSELKTKLFLHIPSHRAKYFRLILPNIISVAFPIATKELICAGDCLAAGLHTASVFHSMRAAEVGVRTLAAALAVTFSYPIELAEWGNIVGEIEKKIAAIKGSPRSQQRDDDLKFYSEAAAQFRYFNDGWRIRVAHAREAYDENQAIAVIDHTLNFFQTLAQRLKE